MRIVGVSSQGAGKKTRLSSTKYRVLAIVLVVVVVFAAYYLATSQPTQESPYQPYLDRAVGYLSNQYNPYAGLIPELPNGTTFWLFSDNYLASLAFARYGSSYSGFPVAIDSAIRAYESLLPQSDVVSQYTALNSTTASFDCPLNYSLRWGLSNGSLLEKGQDQIRTTSNTGDPSCAEDNYADLQLLQAVYYHRLGNNTGALWFYGKAVADFNEGGMRDKAYLASGPDSEFQTYKTTLLVYATICLGQQSQQSENLGHAENYLLSLQSPTGGFYTAYTLNLTSLNAPGVANNGSVNTETTSLAALALELMVSPTGAC